MRLIQTSLLSGLEILRMKLDDLKGLTIKEEQAAMQIKVKFRCQREGIICEFEELQRLASEEQHRLLVELEEKELELQSIIRKNVAELEVQQASIQKLMSEMEEKSEQPDVELLKDVKSTLSRCERMVSQKSEDVSPAQETNLAAFWHPYTGLSKIAEFIEWRRARSYADDVSLDPDTNHFELELSEDLRSVRFGDGNRILPDNPERFRKEPCVLGWQKFTTGRHYWEVEVGGAWGVALGVCDDAACRDEEFAETPKSGYWAVSKQDDDGYRALTYPFPGTPLKSSSGVRTVGVFLDHSAGRVSFYNVEEKSHLFTFPPCTFPPLLRPFFSTEDEDQPLRLIRVLGWDG